MTDNSRADLPNPFVDDPELRGLIRIEPETGHWLWIGDLDDDGYGTLFREGYHWRAHRWLWILVNGWTELPIDHVCRTRRCVNPFPDGKGEMHLEPVTTAVNNQRIPTWGGNATHCAKGHEFTPENTGKRSDGKRKCLTCHREQERERRAKRKSANTT